MASYRKTFDGGYLLQIRQRTITSHARLIMKEARNGLFTETPSLNGNGRLARCYVFTVNVRVLSFYYSRISNRDSVFQRGPERACFCTQYFISILSDD